MLTVPIKLVFILCAALGTSADGGAPLFDYREIVLDNGLRVITLEDFSCPIVNVQVWYHAGSKDEQPDRRGFAHMFEHMMFRGTDRLGSTDHFDLINGIGGHTNAYTSFDRTVYYEEIPAGQLELALYLEAERMAFLKLDQESFDVERKVVEEERRVYLEQPYGQLFDEVLELVFPDHPYRWYPLGNIADLRAASVSELRDFWTRYYAPSNATLIIVGAVGHAEAQRLAEQYFGWIPRGEDRTRMSTQPELSKVRKKTLWLKSAPAPLVAVAYRTVPAGHDDMVPLKMLATILGEGSSSRLYRELVAEKKLALMAFADYTTLEQGGVLSMAAVMSPLWPQRYRTIRTIKAQVRRLQEEPVSERELTKTRNSMLKSLVTRNLTIGSKAYALGYAAVDEGDVSRANDIIRRMRSVTAEDLQRVAQTYLVPDRSLTIKVEQDILGKFFSWLFGIKSAEESAKITAEPEQFTPPPGRDGAARPEGYPPSPPVAEVMKPDITPKFYSQMLDNGLKVIVVPNHELPFVSMRLGLRAGAWCEDKPGTARMSMNMLTKGTEDYSEAELADQLGVNAISLWASANMEEAYVSGNCLTEQVARMMTLCGQVALHPTFPPEELARLRKQVLAALKIQADSPQSIAAKHLRIRLYGDHPYARSATGETSDVKALTVADLKTWWSTFVRPDMAVLLLAGDIDQTRAMELANKTFGDWTASGPVPTISIPEPPAPAETHIYLVNKPGSNQAQISIAQLGITRKDPHEPMSDVVNRYFGRGMPSRLMRTVRVEKGLTYGINGGYWSGRFAGSFGVHTFSKTATTVEAVRAVLEEIQRLKDQGPAQDELAKARLSILGSFPGKRETPQAVLNDLWTIELHDLSADYYQQSLNMVAKTTAEDCLKLIGRTVDPSRMVIVVVGNARKLKKGLQAIAPVTVVKK